MPRVVIALMDSFGIGGAPDAGDYFNDGVPDTGANTFLHIAEACAKGGGDRAGLRAGPLRLPNLDRLGLGAAGRLSSGVLAPGFSADAVGFWAVGREVSRGKDTPSGHWEIAGVPVPFEWGYFPKTIPCFPDELVATIVAKAGLPGILGNRHGSGTVIINELGEEHIRTGKPICYTSADSVFQIAAHETHFGLDRLYDLCKTVFRLTAPMMIGRVIARPFVGETPADFRRTGNRHDYAIAPPEPTLLDRVSGVGFDVYAIGKISDIYAGSGVTHKIKASGNMALMDRTLEALDMCGDHGLVFTNFVDFDQDFGHRRDIPGYAHALEQFDARLPELMTQLRDDDLLVMTADHGNDPSWTGTDHTREQVPVLIYARSLRPGSAGIRQTLADIGETAARWLGIAPGRHGRSFL
ncbi:MAG: phosphopentomutase [Alphaproteobacteria bacterium]|nr:phosphopentomutase [Alphaproteobacteria bacterium]